MNRVQTDNSHLEEKIKLRLDNLPPGDPLKVLDLFSGNGLLWEEIQKRTGRNILVLRTEKKPGKTGIYLIGDNRKFEFYFSTFDVVDVDAYGIPFDQMEKIFRWPTRPRAFFVTWIQSGMGQLPHKLLEALGYSREMVKKIPSLFNRNGQEKLFQYLALRGVKKVKIYFTADRRKSYLYIGND